MKTKLSLIALVCFVSIINSLQAGTKVVAYSSVTVHSAPCGASIPLGNGISPYFTKNEVIVKFTSQDAYVKVGITCTGNAKHAYYFTLRPRGLPLNRSLKFIFTCTSTGASSKAIEIREYSCPGDGSSSDGSSSSSGGKLVGFVSVAGCPSPCTFNGTIVFGGRGPISTELAKWITAQAVPPAMHAPSNLINNVKELATPELLAPLENVNANDFSAAKSQIVSTYKAMLDQKVIKIGAPESNVEYFLELNKAFTPTGFNAQQIYTLELRNELVKVYSAFKK